MAARTGASASRDAKCFNMTQTEHDHPYRPRGLNGMHRSQLAPWTRHLYLFVPGTAFIAMATTWRYWQPKAEMKAIVDNARNTLDYIGSLASIMAKFTPKESSDGAGAFGPVTHSVVHVLMREDDPKVLAGFIIAVAWAHSPYDDSDVKGKDADKTLHARQTSRDPAHITQSQISIREAMAADKTRGISHPKHRAHQQRSKALQTFFQSMSGADYFKMCAAYSPIDLGPSAEMRSISLDDSPLNPLRVFNLKSALLHAMKSGAAKPMYDPRSYEIRDGKNNLIDFTSPEDGQWSYRVRGEELDPSHLPNCFFPHEGRASASSTHAGFEALLERYAPPPLTALLMRYAPRPDDPNHEAKMETARERAHTEYTEGMAHAKRRAQDMLNMAADGTADGFTLSALKSRLSRTYEDAMANARSTKIHPDLEGDPKSHAILARMYRYEHEAYRAWQEDAISQLRCCYTADGAISDSQRAKAKWMGEWLSNNKSFSMPYNNPWKELSPWGMIVANDMLIEENIGRNFVNHGDSFFLYMAALVTPMGSGIRLNVWIYGETATGKSRIVVHLQDQTIPGTVVKCSGKSAQADAVPDNQSLECTIEFWEETDPIAFGMGGPKQKMGEKGTLTGADQANTKTAAFNRDLLSSGNAVVERFTPDPDGGPPRKEVIVIQALKTWLCCSNVDFTDLAPNMRDRFCGRCIRIAERPGMSFVHCASMKDSPKIKAYMKAINNRKRRDQLLAEIIYIAQKIGIVPDFESNLTDSIICQILERAKLMGSGTMMQPRPLSRVKMLARGCATLDAFYRALDGPERFMHENEAWTMKRFLMGIQFMLIVRPEHLIWSMTAMMSEWENPVIPAIVRALDYHFKLGIDAGRGITSAPGGGGETKSDDDIPTPSLHLSQGGPRSRGRGGRGSRARGRGRGRGSRGRGGRGGGGDVRWSVPGFPAETFVFEANATDMERINPPDDSPPMLPNSEGKHVPMPDAEGREFTHFYYWTWSDKGIVEPVTNVKRAHKFARLMEPIIKMKVPQARIEEAVIGWLSLKVPIPDPLDPEEPSSLAFRFTGERLASGGCTTLRIAKSFLSNQFKSLIVGCIENIISRAGFPQDLYALGQTEVDRPYIIRLLGRPQMPEEEREPFLMPNLNVISPIADEILGQLVLTATNAGDSEAPVGRVNEVLNALVQSTKYYTVRPGEDPMDEAIQTHLTNCRYYFMEGTNLRLHTGRCIDDLIHWKNQYLYRGFRAYPNDAIYEMGIADLDPAVVAYQFPLRSHSTVHRANVLRFLRSDPSYFHDNNIDPADAELKWEPEFGGPDIPHLISEAEGAGGGSRRERKRGEGKAESKDDDDGYFGGGGDDNDGDYGNGSDDYYNVPALARSRSTAAVLQHRRRTPAEDPVLVNARRIKELEAGVNKIRERDRQAKLKSIAAAAIAADDGSRSPLPPAWAVQQDREHKGPASDPPPRPIDLMGYTRKRPAPPPATPSRHAPSTRRSRAPQPPRGGGGDDDDDGDVSPFSVDNPTSGSDDDAYRRHLEKRARISHPLSLGEGASPVVSPSPRLSRLFSPVARPQPPPLRAATPVLQPPPLEREDEYADLDGVF